MYKRSQLKGRLYIAVPALPFDKTLIPVNLFKTVYRELESLQTVFFCDLCNTDEMGILESWKLWYFAGGKRISARSQTFLQT